MCDRETASLCLWSGKVAGKEKTPETFGIVRLKLAFSEVESFTFCVRESAGFYTEQVVLPHATWKWLGRVSRLALILMLLIGSATRQQWLLKNVHAIGRLIGLLAH